MESTLENMKYIYFGSIIDRPQYQRYGFRQIAYLFIYAPLSYILRWTKNNLEYEKCTEATGNYAICSTVEMRAQVMLFLAKWIIDANKFSQRVAYYM